VRTERQLAEALSGSAAWREAALAKGGDLQVRRELGTRKASTEAWVAARRAEQLALDVATLQAALHLTRNLTLTLTSTLTVKSYAYPYAYAYAYAQQAAALLQEVDSLVVGREVAELEGQLSFLRAQLQHEGAALQLSRAAEAGLATRLHEAVEAAAAAQLELDYMRDQGRMHL